MAQGKVNTEDYRLAKERLITEREGGKLPYLAAVLASLKELAEYAGAMGVKLGLENRYHYYEIPLLNEAEQLLREVDASTVFYWHDAGHAHNLEVLGFQRHHDLLEALGSRILGVHLHDAVGTRDHRVAGSGEIDFRTLRMYVAKDAIQVCEFDGYASPDEVKAGLEHLRRIGFFS